MEKDKVSAWFGKTEKSDELQGVSLSPARGGKNRDKGKDNPVD